MGYSLKDGMFAIENFDRQPPFSSFLPGVCGADGVPAWAFYVNRGQGIASFGVDDKNHAIMEFSPAVIAYEDTARKGFRTFLQSNLQTWEPFEQDNNCIRNMYISPNSVLLTETDNVHNICTEVKYFMLPGEDTAALIRKVRIRNSGPDTKNLEILDGMSRILPYGILNSEFKEMANLLKSYGKVTFDDKNIAYFSVNASTENNERVEITKGSYYFLTSCNHTLIRPVCDPAAVFGQDTSLGFPRRFAGKTAGETAAGLQYTENKIPCAFTPVSVSLLAGESIEFYTMIGFCRDPGIIDSLYHKLLDSRWFLQKEREAEILAQQITAPMKIHTAFPIFDAYAEQNWLDNVLRGGMSSLLGNWMGKYSSAMMVLIIVNVWQYAGMTMVIYLAGLQSIPEELYESAKIDGAGSWQIFRYVTIPLLMPSIRINIVTNIIGSLSVFDIVMSLTGGGPGYSTETLSIYIMRMCYGSKTGYSTAVALILFVIILVPVAVSMRMTRSKD